MAGKKKKKPAANPARGFATVSVASKPKSTDTVENSPNRSNTPVEPRGQVDQPEIALQPASASIEEQSRSKDIQEMTPEELEQHLEYAELQTTVETYAAKVKTDAERQVSRLVNERRQLRQQADRVTIPGLTEYIVEKVLEHDLNEVDTHPRTSVKRVINQYEDSIEMLVDMWTLREVLQRLEMPDIDNALAHYTRFRRRNGTTTTTTTSEYISGLDICLNWYAKYKSAAELPDYITGAIGKTEVRTESAHTGIAQGKSKSDGYFYPLH